MPKPFTTSSIFKELPWVPSAVTPDWGVGCIPVMAVVLLSRITRVNFFFFSTASYNGGKQA